MLLSNDNILTKGVVQLTKKQLPAFAGRLEFTLVSFLNSTPVIEIYIIAAGGQESHPGKGVISRSAC